MDQTGKIIPASRLSEKRCEHAARRAGKNMNAWISAIISKAAKDSQ